MNQQKVPELTRLTSFCFLIALICGAGCASITDPLEGWTFIKSAYVGNPFDSAIADDYKSYILTLSGEQQHVVNDSLIRFFEDKSGLRAVRISLPLNGIWLEHVLIYAKSDKRIKVITYKSGRYGM
jgi:hypothetical protein